jgi:hypothetical protein
MGIESIDEAVGGLLQMPTASASSVVNEKFAPTRSNSPHDSLVPIAAAGPADGTDKEASFVPVNMACAPCRQRKAPLVELITFDPLSAIATALLETMNGESRAHSKPESVMSSVVFVMVIDECERPVLHKKIHEELEELPGVSPHDDLSCVASNFPAERSQKAWEAISWRAEKCRHYFNAEPRHVKKR